MPQIPASGSPHTSISVLAPLRPFQLQKHPRHRATEEQSQGDHVQRARPIQKNGAAADQQKLAGDICKAQASSVFEDDSAEVTTKHGFGNPYTLRQLAHIYIKLTWHVQPCVKADSSGWSLLVCTCFGADVAALGS